MDFTRSEWQFILEGLAMRRCMIETGNPVLSAADVAARKEPARALDVEQMRAVVILSDLYDKVLDQMRSGRAREQP